MKDEHRKDVVPVRTFADDVKRLKESGSINTDIDPEEDAEKEKDEQPTITKKEEVPKKKIILAPKTPDKEKKSAFDYLSQKPKANESVKNDPEVNQTDIQKTEAKTILRQRSTPTIPNTEILREVEHVGNLDKTSVFSDEVDIVDGDIGGGTIIQDRKRNKFRLLPAIGRALFGWYKKKERALSGADDPKYTITKAEARIETIKTAAKASKRAPSEDYREVANRLRAEERPTISSDVIIKDKSEIPEPSWTHAVGEESEFAAEEVGTPIISNLETETQAVEVAPTSEPAPVIYEEKPEEVELKPLPTPEPEPTTENIPPSDEENTFRQELRAAAERKKILATKDGSANQANYDFKLREIPLYIFVIGVLAISLLGIGIGLYLLTKADNTDITPVTTTLASVVNIPNEVEFVFDQNIDQLTYALATSDPDGEVKTAVIKNREGETISSNKLMATIAPSIPSSFARNLDDAAVGYSSNGPFIVLEGSNFDYLLGGLLNWEQNMGSDLAPLFGFSVKETRTYSNTNKVLNSTTFTDEVVSGNSARVLRNNKGEVILIYSLITDTIAVIADNQFTITDVTPYINKQD